MGGARGAPKPRPKCKPRPKHGMTGQRNASKDFCLNTQLPRVRCSTTFKQSAVTRAKALDKSWSSYIRELINKDLGNNPLDT